MRDGLVASYPVVGRRQPTAGMRQPGGQPGRARRARHWSCYPRFKRPTPRRARKAPAGLSPNSPMWDPSPGELTRPLDGSAVAGCGGGFGGGCLALTSGLVVPRRRCRHIMWRDPDSQLSLYRRAAGLRSVLLQPQPVCGWPLPWPWGGALPARCRRWGTIPVPHPPRGQLGQPEHDEPRPPRTRHRGMTVSALGTQWPVARRPFRERHLRRSGTPYP